MFRFCVYTKGTVDGWQTAWRTECKHTVVCKVPEEIGFQAAPLPTDDGAKYCCYCGKLIQLKERT